MLSRDSINISSPLGYSFFPSAPREFINEAIIMSPLGALARNSGGDAWETVTSESRKRH